MADPNFNLTTPSPYDLSTGVFNSAAPVFADIDGDSDLDAFVGNSYGNTIFFQNTGTINSPTFAAPTTNPFGLSNVGNSASPAFVDINSDGKLDAFVGNVGGDVLFYLNAPSGVLLISTAGDDILTGTISLKDTVSYVSAAAAVTVSLAISAKQNTLGAGLDTLTHIQSIILRAIKQIVIIFRDRNGASPGIVTNAEACGY